MIDTPMRLAGIEKGGDYQYPLPNEKCPGIFSVADKRRE
jgi:hypothetical protein